MGRGIGLFRGRGMERAWGKGNGGRKVEIGGRQEAC